MPPAGESDPLLQSPNSNNSNNSNSNSNSGYYFLHKADPAYTGGSTSAVIDAGDEGQVVEGPPPNSIPEEFAPRPVAGKQHMRNPSDVMSGSSRKAHDAPTNSSSSGGGGFFAKFFGSKAPTPPLHSSAARSVMDQPKLRKAPVKIEPKVFFSNERTFLAWMHLSVVLAGASIAILAFADDQNPLSQLYGVVLLPVAIAFIVYSMYQYSRRARMIRTRHPGPYEDTVGPTVLGIMLMASIVVQFALKLYAMQF